MSCDFMHRNVEVWAEWYGRFGVGTVCLGALPACSLDKIYGLAPLACSVSVIHGATLMPRPPGISFDFSCIFIPFLLKCRCNTSSLLRVGTRLQSLSDFLRHAD